MDESVKEIMSKSDQVYALLIGYATTYGLKLLGAAVILLVGFWLTNRVTQVADTAFGRKDFDTTIRVYLSRILSVAFKVFVVITAAGVLGVETTSFVAVLGAAGLAVGLALQGSLANFAGGVLILVLRPFRVGDLIIAQGEEGVVSAIDVFYTTIIRADNRRVIIPNGPLIGNVITNSSAEPFRRVEVAVGISYSDSIDKAESVLLKLAADHPKVVKDPAPQVGMMRFGDSSVDLVFRAWCKHEDYVEVYFDLHRKTKSAFDSAGITIPFPQREVRTFTSAN